MIVKYFHHFVQLFFVVCRFYPSAAQAIAERILAEELTNQVYDEEEAKYWSLNISDKVREAIHGIRFTPLSLSPSIPSSCLVFSCFRMLLPSHFSLSKNSHLSYPNLPRNPNLTLLLLLYIFSTFKQIKVQDCRTNYDGTNERPR